MPDQLEVDRVKELNARIAALTEKAKKLKIDYLADGRIDQTERESLERIDKKIAELTNLVGAAQPPGSGADAGSDAGSASAGASGGGSGGGGGRDAGSDAPGKAAKPDLKAAPEEKIKDADARLQRTGELIAAFEKLISGGADPTPADWGTERTRIEGVIAPMRGGGAADESALDKELKALQKLEDEILSLTEDKASWAKALKEINDRIAVLDRHPQAGAAPEIKPKIDAIKADLAKAVTDANAQKYAKAEKALPAIAKRCDEVELMADDYAKYLALLPDRSNRVGLTAGPPVGDPEVDNIQTQMQTLLADAATDVGADKFADAVAKLDKIGELLDKRSLTDNARTDYLAESAMVQARINTINGFANDEKALIKDKFDQLKKMFADAQYTKTKSYVRSMQLLDKIGVRYGGNIAQHMIDTVTNYRAYNANLATFKPQYDKLKAHAGRSGIESFFQGIDNDYTQAQAEAGARRYVAGSQLLTHIPAATWAAEEQKAGDCKDYKDKRAQVEPKLEAERARAITAAANALAQCDALMATAERQSLAQDFAGALASVTEAESRVADAKTAGDAGEKMGDLRDGKALDDIAKDFDAAFKVFTDMQAHVKSLDGAGDLSALVARADDPANKAKAEAAKAAPDYTVARKHLDDAIAELEAAMPKVLALKPYKDHLADAKAMRDTTLPGINADDCIKPRIDAIRTLIDDAERLARASAYDFAAAEVKLSEAMELAGRAQVEAGLWGDIKSDKATTQGAVSDVAAAPAAVSTAMAARTTTLNAIIAEIDRLVAVPDFKAAAKEAARGAAMRPVTQDDIISVRAILNDKPAWYDNRIANISPPAVTTAPSQHTLATKMFADYTRMMNDEAWEAAYNKLFQAKLAIDDGIRVVAEANVYAPAAADAKTKLDAVVAVRNEGVEEELKALEARYTAAKAQGDAGNFRRPGTEMQKIAQEAVDLLPKANAYQSFLTAAADARTQLAAAESHAQAAAIQPMITRLQAKETKAKDIAKGGDPALGETMMKEISVAAEEAVTSADKAAILAGVNAAIAETASDDGPSFVHIAAARGVYTFLVGKDEAPHAEAELKEADAQLKIAEDDTIAGKERTEALRAGTAACTKADEAMLRYKLLTQIADRAKAKAGELKAHPQKDIIAKDIAALEARVDEILAAAKGADSFDKASADLEAVMAEYHTLLEAADGHAEYIALRKPELETLLTTLEGHDHRYAIKDKIDAIRQKLDQAAQKAEARDYPAAMKLLNEVRSIGLGAEMLADMRGDTPPTTADVEKLIAGPGGIDELDAMIESLEPEAQRSVLRVAFEARFGVDLDIYASAAAESSGGATVPDGTLSGPNLKRFYEIMSDLPDPSAIDSDGMRDFHMIDQANAGGSSWERDKRVVMNEGDYENSDFRGFGLEHEVSDLDPECKPANQDPVNMFSWNTLHEVGHAVDDQHGFMAKNGSGAAYGGWKAHDFDIEPIAKLLAGKFKYDVTYIAELMSRNDNAAVPPKPSGEACSDEEWETRRVKLVAFVQAARSENNPWASSATANRLVIDGRVYQESYNHRWSSYNISARKQGITGYQFRAPGEWFSEIYAAYHSGKLKPGHPAVKWLSTLEGPGT